MSRLVFAIAVLGLLPSLGRAQDKKDPLPDLLAKLRKPVELIPGDNVNLGELKDLIADKHGVQVLINNAAFNMAVGENATGFQVEMPKAKGLPLGAVLKQVLSQRDATFLVRKSHIEIVPNSVAAKEAKVTPEEDGTVVLPVLVSAVYKEKPLNEALADLAEEHDLTITVAPQAADNKAAFINARLLNVPADKAIELMAIQADLRVVRKGNAWLITSKDHEQELFERKLERSKQKKEVELLGTPPFGSGQPPMK
ncbi:MAG: hypothetical protein U0791_01215 [Gemmataceae bacterium]